MLICIKGPHFSVMSGCVCSGHYEKIKLGWQDSRQAKNGIRSHNVYNTVDFTKEGCCEMALVLWNKNE